MPIDTILNNLLSNVMHLKRLNSLKVIVYGVFEAKHLSVTGLGRSLQLPIQERSGIRKVDRLVGNKKLHGERLELCQKVSNYLIANQKRPWIIVDWSPVPNSTNNVLRAALVCKGRALSLYEEVHSGSKLGNRKVQNFFLKTLKKIVHQGCSPIIVTDAGFHAPWFNSVKKQGWDFVGRVRGRVTYCPEGHTKWLKIKNLYSKATQVEKFSERVTLSKCTPCEGSLYYYKGKSKNRINKNKLGKKRGSKDSQNYARSNKEPWVLLSSLEGRGMAKRVVKIYKHRMQIEEGFRDLKSTKYGFGFEHTHSKNIMRLENLLLIAMLASIVAWIIGWQAEKEKLHYQFQANSIKNRRVLSLFFLGCRIIKKKIRLEPIKFTSNQFVWAEY